MAWPRKKNPITYEQVKVLYDQGMSTYAIAKELGCSEYLVESRLDRQDIKRNAYVACKERTPRFPILVEEISRYRENLQIGQKLRLEYKVEDGFKKIKKVEDFVVIEKSTWLFTAQNARGHKVTKTYKEMLVEERKKQNADQITG